MGDIEEIKGSKAPSIKNFRTYLKQWGPSFIVLGSIVGYGELVMMGSLGAIYGFTIFWAMCLMCWLRLLQTWVLAGYCMSNNLTAPDAWNTAVPGPKYLGKTNWYNIYNLLYTILPFGLIFGGNVVASLAGMLNWAVGGPAWVWVLTLIIGALLINWSGRYRDLERIFTIIVAIFTATTIIAFFLLQTNQVYSLTFTNIIEGISFKIPDGTDITTFFYMLVTLGSSVGYTWSELTTYATLTVGSEKGWGTKCLRFKGESEESWISRVKGWINIMKVESTFGHLIAWIACTGYFTMGALVLHRLGLIPSGLGLVATLGTSFLEAFGPWGKWLYVFGAFGVLFSSLAVYVIMGNRRLTYIVESIGWRSKDEETHKKTLRFFSIYITLAYLIIGLIIVLILPMPLVISQITSLLSNIGNTIGAFLTILIVFKTRKEFRPSRLVIALLIVTVAISVTLMTAALYQSFVTLLTI